MMQQLNNLNKELVNNQYRQKDCNKAISDAQKEIKNTLKAEQDRAKQLEDEKKRREELNKIIDETNAELDTLDSLKDKDGKLTKEQEKQYKALCNTMQKAFTELNSLTLTEEQKNKLDEEGRQKIETLNGTIEQEKLKLSQLRTEQAGIKQLITETSKAIVEESKVVEESTDAVDDNNNQWSTLKETLAHVAADGIEKISSKLVEVGKNIIAVGEEFTSSMSEVGAISGATAEELALLEQTAREYGSTTKFSASECAQALKYMALAGWDVQQSIEGLPGVLKLAQAGNMNLGKASDIVTDYLTAFGWAAEDSAKFVDIMTYAMNNSNTDVEQLGEAYKNCAANAGAMGYSVEETTAALMTMANAGIKGGEAGTSLSAIMTRLATDTKGCATELAKYGVQIYDSEGNMQSLSSILVGIAKNWENLTDQEQSNLAKMIAGQNQLTGFRTIMAGLSDSAKDAGMSFEDYTAALENCSGTASAAAKTMSDNLSGDIKTMNSAFEELALKIYDDGETPIRSLVQTITKEGVPALEMLISHADKIAPIFIGAASAVGGYKAAMAIQSIIAGITQATVTLTGAKVAETSATEGATAAQATLNSVQAANPIGLLVAALGLLIGTLTSYSLIANNAAKDTDHFTEATSKAKQSAEDLAKALDSAKDKYANSIGAAESEAATIEVLAERYDELRNKQNLTKADKAELIVVAQELAEKLNTTTDELQDQIGRWIDIKDKVEEYTQTLREKAELEAQEELYKDAIKERTKAQIEYNQSVKELRDYYRENQQAIDQMNEIGYMGELTEEYKKYQEMSAAAIELEKQIDAATNLENEYADAISKTTSNIAKNTKSMMDEDSSVDTLNDDIADLNNTITDTDKELQSTSKTEEDIVSQAFSDINDTISMIKKIESEVESGGSMTLSTLSSIIKKYPELTDKVNDYINGVTDEKTLIESLKTVYDNDVNNYNSALALKKLKQGEFTADMAQASSDLVNKYKEHYGIDLQNFTSAEAAKLAVQEQIYQKMLEARAEYNKLLDEENYQVFQNAYGRQVLARDSSGNWRELTGKELEAYDKTRNNYFDSQKNYNNFDGDAFVKNLTQDLLKTFKGTSADSIINIPTSSNSSGTSGSGASGSGSDKTTWTSKALGETGSGSTVTDAHLDLLSKLESLGKVSLETEKKWLEDWLKNTSLTYDEKYKLRVKLKSVEDKLTEEEQKKQDELQKKQEEQRKSQLEYAKAAYEYLVKGQQEAYQKMSDAAQKAADKEIAALDDVLKKRKELNEDNNRQKEIDAINAQLEYAQLDSLSRYELERKKQDLLNEQAEVDFERDIEAKKEQIQAKADVQVSKNTEAIDRLNKTLESAAYYLAKLGGNQTSSQVVNNSTKTQNINYIKQGMGDEAFAKFIKMIY